MQKVSDGLKLNLKLSLLRFKKLIIGKQNKRNQKGQLSLEFLFILAAYVLFIFILISSINYSKLLEQLEDRNFYMKVRSLQLIETQRLINNRFTDMNLILEGCALPETAINSTIICKKGNITKSLAVPLRDVGADLLVVKYKPLS